MHPHRDGADHGKEPVEAVKIGLIDVDNRHFPNLALMKLSSWHKARGDDVEWWSGFTHYDRVYLSKVFTFSPDHDTVIDADRPKSALLLF